MGTSGAFDSQLSEDPGSAGVELLKLGQIPICAGLVKCRFEIVRPDVPLLALVI